MRKIKLGAQGPEVSALGLGCMGMSISHGEPDDPEFIATMHRAIELGCNLLVTSDAYGSGVNEALIAKAIKGRRDQVLIATKFGNLGLAARTGCIRLLRSRPSIRCGAVTSRPKSCRPAVNWALLTWCMHRWDAVS